MYTCPRTIRRTWPSHKAVASMWYGVDWVEGKGLTKIIKLSVIFDCNTLTLSRLAYFLQI